MNLLLRNTGVISKHTGIMEVTQLELQKNYHSEIKFSDRKMSLEQKHKTTQRNIYIQLFVTQYYPALPSLKDTLGEVAPYR